MTRRISNSELRNKMRQAVNKTNQAINQYNQAVRRYNQDVNRAINKYNQEVRTHNSRVRANRQRINQELARLQRISSSPRYTTLQSSVYTLHKAYVRLEARSAQEHVQSNYSSVFDLSERENANSLEVMNALLDDAASEERNPEDLRTTEITTQLKNISEDLDNRWRGAIFALSPHNPDAARHFCTSAREIFTQIFDLKAPDHDVVKAISNYEKTERGTPSRRTKIKYFMQQKKMDDEALEAFIQEDVENILQLFHVLSGGTHGPSGKFTFHQLSAIKKRVEDGIAFLSTIVQ